MNIENSKRKSFSFSPKRIWIVFVICVAVIAGTFSGIFSYIALALSIVAIFILSEEDTLCFLMFIMPFAGIFKSSPQSQSFFTYLILLYVLWYFLKKGRLGITFSFVFFLLVVFLIAQMVISLNVLRAIKFIANVLLIYFAVNSRMSGDSKRIYVFYILGVVISSAVAALNIIPNLSVYIGSKDLGFAYDELVRFSAMYPDPNYYSVNLIISLCLIVVLYHNKQMGVWTSIILASAILVFIVMTFSKSAFLMLILPILLLLYSKVKNRKYLLFFTLFAAGIVIIANIFAGKIEVFDIILSRLSGGDLDSITTGRTELWVSYIKFLWDSPDRLFFGSGLGAGLIGEYAAHNTYLDLLYYIGIIGTAILLTTLVIISRMKQGVLKRNLLNYSVWLCILVMYFFLSELFYFDWPFHIIIAIFVSKTKMETVECK